MAEYTVPQDVEADDKLLGPFGFRQLVYLMIAAAAGFVAFVLSQISIPLLVIPLPIVIFFLVIALPLRKDQPTEIYIAAMISYMFKPHLRLWKADGEQTMVEIGAPIVDDTPKVKDIAGEEVSRRLSFLSNLTDTQGWSTRGIGLPNNDTNLSDEFASDAINAVDVIEDSAVSDSINSLLDKSDRQMKNKAIQMMNQAANNSTVNTQLNTVPPTAPSVNLPTVMPHQSTQPDLTNPVNLPTYNLNGGNLQATVSQPHHNNISIPTISTDITSPTIQQPVLSQPPAQNTQPVAQPEQKTNNQINQSTQTLNQRVQPAVNLSTTATTRQVEPSIATKESQSKPPKQTDTGINTKQSVKEPTYKAPEAPRIDNVEIKENNQNKSNKPDIIEDNDAIIDIKLH